ncbi:MAG: DNA polymerase III subunit gamma/tau [bacterium]
MSLALYRKYRPHYFRDVIGQEHVVRTLTNALSSGSISHAYLFCGPRGSGKTTIARLLAKAVNCEDKTSFEPCDKCSSCIEISESRSMDLVEIDAASNRGIDDIKELREGIRYLPTKLKYKVFILDEAHQLSKDAANALLKTLEEPPSHAIFILATTEAHKMIPTIVSRCQRFDFRKLTVPEITKRLEIVVKNEKAKISQSAINLIAVNSGGSMRDGESLLNQAISFSQVNAKDKEVVADDIKDLLGLVEIQVVGKLVEFIVGKDQNQAIRYLGELIDKGTDVEQFIRALIDYLRQGLIVKMTDENDYSTTITSGLTKEEYQLLVEQVKKLKAIELRKLIGAMIEAENKMRYASITQLPLELAIAEFCELN